MKSSRGERGTRMLGGKCYGGTVDTRCGTCGSLLFSVVRDGAYVHVSMGSLVDAPTIRPTHQMFVGSKAAWFEITDDLPQFPRARDIAVRRTRSSRRRVRVAQRARGGEK